VEDVTTGKDEEEMQERRFQVDDQKNKVKEMHNNIVVDGSWILL
jgi:hypothetical protein